MRLSQPVILLFAFVLTLSFGLSAEEMKSPYPWMEKDQVLSIGLGPNNRRNSEGDFLALDNGEILFVYTHFYGESGNDHDSAYLASRSSFDGGKTWTQEDKIEIENEGGCNVMDVTLRKLADGRFAIFYAVKESTTDCRPVMRIRQEDGTWGERVFCVSEPSYNSINNDRMIQLAGGRILFPCGCHAFLGKNDYDYESNGNIFCAISDDGGATWRKGGSLEPTPNVVYQEGGLCELADGRILLNVRTESGFQYFAYSEDGGETWGKAFASCLDSPLSPTLIKRIPGSDDLLAVGNADLKIPIWQPGFRGAMMINRLSPDGSRILSRKTLEYPENDREDWQYPAIHFVGDGSILVAYFSWNLGIRIYRMNLSDL